MTSGYQALTSKEKETLRLLVNGYDAKSMARHLGLSVHTVNERLRDARRKMAVSSSREAARLMREAEGSAPQSLVPELLGDATTLPSIEKRPDPESGRGGLRRIAWVIGGIIMVFSLALLALTSLSEPVPSPARSQAQPTNPVEPTVVQSTRSWLALVDASDWQQSWQATAQSFRTLNTVDGWRDASLKVRVPLGAVTSRTLLSADDVPTPPNGSMVVKFRTSFATKPQALETLALVREDGEWRVVGYYIE
jgi:DNA-binding CsgD family transcriptional regulator